MVNNSSYKLNISSVIVFLVLLTFVLGCSTKSASKESVSEAKPASFTLPKLPVMLATADERREYLSEHYWDNLDFKDTALLNSDSIMGTALAGYVNVIQGANSKTKAKGINSLLKSAEKEGYDTFERFTSLMEDYLYDPNSPLRNEDIYIYVLRYVVDSANLEDIQKVRAQKQLEMVLKNRVGEKAANFAFTEANGVKSSLNSIKSSFTILFFNTPGCEDCHRVKEIIENSEVFKDLVKSKELTVLGLYPEADEKLWRESSYPKIMINAIDKGQIITKNKLYDLRALPTLYLLDAEKRILMKDRFVEEVEMYLQAQR